jgi:hypothetical protein
VSNIGGVRMQGLQESLCVCNITRATLVSALIFQQQDFVQKESKDVEVLFGKSPVFVIEWANFVLVRIYTTWHDYSRKVLGCPSALYYG